MRLFPCSLKSNVKTVSKSGVLAKSSSFFFLMEQSTPFCHISRFWRYVTSSKWSFVVICFIFLHILNHFRSIYEPTNEISHKIINFYPNLTLIPSTFQICFEVWEFQKNFEFLSFFVKFEQNEVLTTSQKKLLYQKMSEF